MKTVLIADDKPAGRELIHTVLVSCGYTVIEAALIILDLHMPELDGFQVIAELRREEEFALTPIVALTASAMQGDRERALSAGFTGYITKPIRLTDLRAEVQLLLR